MSELVKLNLNKHDKDSYLFGSTTNFIASTRIGENTPYNRFHKCLTELKLNGKDYTLYSFKHLSNVKKYIAGWTPAQISKANRHATVTETDTYLKNLLKFVEYDKAIPPI
jgi:hypothetical protein